MMKRKSRNWVSISILQSFRRVKSINFTNTDIAWAVNAYSSELQVNRKTLRIRRKYELPRVLADESNRVSRSLKVENLPLNITVTELEKQFGETGLRKTLHLPASSMVKL